MVGHPIYLAVSAAVEAAAGVATTMKSAAVGTVGIAAVAAAPVAVTAASVAVGAGAVVAAAVPAIAAVPVASSPVAGTVKAAAVVAVIPRAGTDEDAADKPSGTVITVRRTSIRIVAKVAVGAYGCWADVGWADSDADRDLGLRVRCRKQENPEQSQVP
jgi:hypothetical protein